MELPVDVSDDAVDGGDHLIPVRRYRPRELTPASPTLVWLHGGGFFRGTLTMPEAHRVALAIAAHGIPVVSAGYRLVPPPFIGWARRPGRTVVRYPLPMNDVLDVIKDVSAEPARCVLGGASAGAALASAAVLARREDPPIGVVLAYGFFHARNPRSPEIQRLVRGHRVITHSRLALDVMNRNYAGSAEAWDDDGPFAGGRDLHGFPPTLMLDAEHDAMRASAERFARELHDHEVAVERHVRSATKHAFLNQPESAAFTESIDLIVDWIRRLAH